MRTTRADGGEIPAYERAVAMLARREHSRAEIALRLRRDGYQDEEVEPALDELESRGLQSDERFCEAFVRARVQRLQGPRKIEAELRERGIASSLIAAALEGAGIDWEAQASQALARRFDGPGQGPREYARRQRFLAGRGFDGEQSRRAMAHAWED
ncbi:regulatory protein RecX [Halotalea alkalilenta]|uniref:Regulatory protein RecX n=1 Tax=Halotalea alkalilenta TaxID=376489 RepID=A0A172YDJ5_9GAMM|nr:regulatory protein RecX [Halotalea alkalilenta]ANF57176.1 hypothetical protein A5892_06610 [Halotalea alkalilenta]